MVGIRYGAVHPGDGGPPAAAQQRGVNAAAADEPDVFFISGQSQSILRRGDSLAALPVKVRGPGDDDIPPLGQRSAAGKESRVLRPMMTVPPVVSVRKCFMSPAGRTADHRSGQWPTVYL